MKKYTEKQLWDFVWRATTIEKIQIACEWLKKQEWLDNDLFDDLMICLSQNSRELYAMQAGRTHHI